MLRNVWRHVSLVVIFLCLCIASAAQAQCQDEGPPTPVGCDDDGALHWEHEEADFNMLSFDSGWLPNGSPLQLRAIVTASSESFVSMDATSTTAWHAEPYPAEDGTWDAALSNRIPGDIDGGLLRVDYGFSFRVFIRFNARVAGQQITFEREINVPGVPMDLRIFDEANFDPFVFAPGEVVVEDTTEPITVLGGSLGDLVNLPSGVDGGIRLDVSAAGSLAYHTIRLITERANERTIDNERIELLPSDSDAGFGPAHDTNLQPLGEWTRDLELLITPNAFVEVLGQRFNIASFSLPVQLASDTAEIDFDPDALHVPLPDVSAQSAITFDTHVVGGPPTEAFLAIRNVGEAPLFIWLSDAPTWLDVPTERIEIGAGSRRTLALAHELESTSTGNLSFYTSDPDTPEIFIDLTAPTSEPPMLDAGVDGGLDAGVDGGLDSGSTGPGGIAGGACGCSAAPSPPTGLFVFLLIGAVVSRRK